MKVYKKVIKFLTRLKVKNNKLKISRNNEDNLFLPQ